MNTREKTSATHPPHRPIPRPLLSQNILSWVYIAGFTLYAISYEIGMTAWGVELIALYPKVNHSVHLIGAALVTSKIVLNRHSLPERLFVLCVLCLSYITLKTTHSNQIFESILLILGARDVSLRRVARIVVISLIVLSVVTFILHGMGLSEGIVGVRRDSGRIRPSLGFAHPNGFGYTCLELSLLLAIIWWRTHPWLHLGVTLILLFLAGGIADSRAATVCLVVCAIITQVGARVSEHTLRSRTRHTVLAWCCLICMVGFIAGTLLLVTIYDSNNPLQYAVNYALSERLTLAHDILLAYPPQLFGRNFAALPKFTYSNGWVRSVSLDMAYARMLLNYGIVYSCIFLGAMVVLYIKAVRERHINACLVLLCFVCGLYALMEWYPFRPQGNPLLIALAVAFYHVPVSSLDQPSERPKRRRRVKAAPLVDYSQERLASKPADKNTPTQSAAPAPTANARTTVVPPQTSQRDTLRASRSLEDETDAV